jgi:uncharacterized protein (DUF924 family)
MPLPIADHWSKTVLRFWFDELAEAQWWSSTPALDEIIRVRFLGLYRQVADDDLSRMTDTPETSLAAVITLDQFPRNMFRRTAEAFATDTKARRIAETAIDTAQDMQLTEDQRQFLYMPLMHAEDSAAQARSLAIFTALGRENNLRAAQEHTVLIQRFGRFPHRNSVLGRVSSAEEVAYLGGEAKRYGQ